MATAAELLAIDNTLVVDSSLRIIKIPSSVTNIGVEHDDDVLSLPFKMPRWYGDLDLSKFLGRINYINANDEPDIYFIENPKVDTDSITFEWLVGKHALVKQGDVKFNLCFRYLDEESGEITKEFNTTPISLKVLEGLEVDSTGEIEITYPDILEQMNARILSLEENGGAGGSGHKEIYRDQIDNTYEPGIYALKSLDEYDITYGWLICSQGLTTDNWMDDDGTTHSEREINQLLYDPDAYKSLMKRKLCFNSTYTGMAWSDWEAVGSGGGGTEDFVVSTTYDGSQKTVTLDKTFDEIMAAYNEGKNVKVKVDFPGGIAFGSLVFENDGQLAFSVFLYKTCFSLVVNSIGAIIVERNFADASFERRWSSDGNGDITLDLVGSNNMEYHYTNEALISITILLPSSHTGCPLPYECSFCFISGLTPTEIIIMGLEACNIYFTGDDCNENGEFTPEPNTRYEVSIKRLGDVLVARVGAY